MISNLWKISDPDNILDLSLEEIAEIEAASFEGDEIYPREDLFQAQHSKTSYILDLGFYGGEVILEGKWILYVIKNENEWESPIERIEFDALTNAVNEL